MYYKNKQQLEQEILYWCDSTTRRLTPRISATQTNSPLPADPLRAGRIFRKRTRWCRKQPPAGSLRPGAGPRPCRKGASSLCLRNRGPGARALLRGHGASTRKGIGWLRTKKEPAPFLGVPAPARARESSRSWLRSQPTVGSHPAGLGPPRERPSCTRL